MWMSLETQVYFRYVYGSNNQFFTYRYTFQEWLDQIEEHYFNERDDLVRQTLQTALENVTDPYGLVVHIIHRGFFDLYSKRLPVTFFALDEIGVWLEVKVSLIDSVFIQSVFKRLTTTKRQTYLWLWLKLHPASSSVIITVCFILPTS